MGALHNADNADRFGTSFDDETIGGVMTDKELSVVKDNIKNRTWAMLEKSPFNPETSLDLVKGESLDFIMRVLNDRIKSIPMECTKFYLNNEFPLEAIPAFFAADESAWEKFRTTNRNSTVGNTMGYLLLDKIKESKIKDLTTENVNALISDADLEIAYRAAIFKYGFPSGLAKTEIENKLIAIRNGLFLSSVQGKLSVYLPTPNNMPYKVWQKKISKAAENPATLIEFVNDPRNAKRIQVAIAEKAALCQDLSKFFNAVKGNTFEQIEEECRQFYIGG